MPHLHTTLGGEDSHLYKKSINLQIIDNRHFIISVKGPVFPLTRVLISRQMWHLPSLPQIYFSVFCIFCIFAKSKFVQLHFSSSGRTSREMGLVYTKILVTIFIHTSFYLQMFFFFIHVG